MTREELMERILDEFPDFTNVQAWTAACRICDTAEQMQFQLDVERDLAALPTTDRRAAA